MTTPRSASKLSAAVLICITVWAFWNLQDSGPEGTLKRFFELARSQNWPDMDRLLLPSDEQIANLTAPEQFVLREANRIGSLGLYRVVRVRRDARMAVVTIQAEDPAYGPFTTTWVLTRPSLRWTVDLKATVIAQSSIGTNLAKEP